MVPPEDHEVIINLKLLKQLRFYHVFNLNVLGCNVYQLSCIICFVIVLCLMIFATTGFFFNLEDKINDFDFFHIITGYIVGYTTLLKMYLFMYSTNNINIWDIFEVTRFNFLTSNHRSKNINILNAYKNRIKLITNVLSIVQLMGCIQWFIFPLLINFLATYENTNYRKLNIFNFRYPFTISTFNQYYIWFYMIEMSMMFFFNLILITLDVFIISLCISIMAQYEVLAKSYENIGYEVKSKTKDNDRNIDSNTDHYREFKSILVDQLQLNLEEISFYSTVRNVVLLEISLVSVFLILMTYMLILICMSTELLSIMNVIKLSFGTIWSIYHLFVYCYLFNNINVKRESLNLAIYSCNWTEVDLKLKKLMLLTMMMNNANHFTIKFSPKKILDLQLFSNIIMTSYNIVSVMVKTLNK